MSVEGEEETFRGGIRPFSSPLRRFCQESRVSSQNRIARYLISLLSRLADVDGPIRGSIRYQQFRRRVRHRRGGREERERERSNRPTSVPPFPATQSAAILPRGGLWVKVAKGSAGRRNPHLPSFSPVRPHPALPTLPAHVRSETQPVECVSIRTAIGS